MYVHTLIHIQFQIHRHVQTHTPDHSLLMKNENETEEMIAFGFLFHVLFVG
jgi:hypothetical protein